MSQTTPAPKKDTLRIHLQALSAELGKVPTVVTMHEKGDYHPETYLDHYDSWEDALEDAGLDPADMGAKKIPDRELLAELHRLDDRLGRSPTKVDMDEHGQYSSKTYSDRFGSWNDALQQAMLDLTQELSDRELLRELERVADELGHAPSSNEMREIGKHRPVTYHRRFGSWVNALEEAGLADRPNFR